MAEALFRFRIDIDSFSRPGVVFHGWKPNSTDSALVLDTGDPSSILKLWVEPWGGFDEDDLIAGGDIHGELTLNHLGNHEMSVLASSSKILDSVDSPDGVTCRTIVKRVVATIASRVEPFLDILRVNYGQYWIEPLYAWDSRQYSLSTYCALFLRLRISVDDGVTWQDIGPDSEWMAGVLNRRNDSEIDEDNRDLSPYLNEADWRSLPVALDQSLTSELSSADYQIVASLLIELRHAMEEGIARYSFVQAITLLEVAVDYYIRRSAKSSTMFKTLQPMRELRLPHKLCAVVISFPVFEADLEMALRAIEIRNRVVHDGHEPPHDEHLVAVLLPGDLYRFPEYPAELRG